MGKVLIVDDEVESLEILKSYLESEHEVITFHSSLEALNTVADIQPDIILMDIEMPFLNGYEMLERIHDIKECAHIPVIGVTGQKSRASVLQFLSKGGAAYLTKPVERTLLQNKVRDMIRQSLAKMTKKKVLIVDDELESLYHYKNMLQPFFNVMALNSGKMAIEYLQKFVPDLIILDYMMPVYNGKTTYQIIRNMEKLKDVPVLFLTGSNDNEVLLECTTLLPNGVILKSGGKEELFKKIRELM